MFAGLALAFLVVPFLELFVILKVGSLLGVVPTIVLLVVVSIVGAWLAKREGLGVVRRIQRSVQQGQMPTNELVDGALIVLAGALLVTPGFLTDLLGISLLLPPLRLAIRGVARKTIARRAGLSAW